MAFDFNMFNDGLNGLFGSNSDQTTALTGFNADDDMFTANGMSQGLKAATGLADAWTGFEAMQTAKDQLAFEKSSFNKNYASSVSDYNTSLEAKQNALNATGDSRYQDTTSYMNEHKLS